MPKIELQPILIGKTIRLRPLNTDDFIDLHRTVSDPQIWKLHPDTERYQREVFHDRFFLGALESGGALAILDEGSGKVIGSSRYYNWDESSKQISIGYTFIERQYWGTGANRELKELMLTHIFHWATVAWFHVGKSNFRSRRAVEKLGTVLLHEEDRILDDKPYTQLFYKLEASCFDA